MDRRYVGMSQFKRVNPFEGLAIDAATWGDAHNYHRELQKLHSLAMHGPGIVDGLVVQASATGDPTVTISPGLAVDPEGNVILVSQLQRYQLQMTTRGTSYLVIQFREIPVTPAGDGGQPTHIMEAYRIQQRDSLPAEPHLELARFRLDGTAPGVRPAAAAANPQANEVDLRFRQSAATRLRGQVTIGLLGRGGSGWHQGLANLARELELGCGYQTAFLGPADLRRGADLYTFLYFDGSQPLSFDQYDLTALGLFIESGGVLMGESCAATGGVESARNLGSALNTITQRLNVIPRPVEWGHPLLNSRYTFSAHPPGIEGSGTLLEASGIIFSSLDYGCAWQGGHQDRHLPRSAVREALEFGVNIAAYAVQRRAGVRR